MKTTLFPLIAIAALAFGTANYSNAAVKNNGKKEVSTTLTAAAKISKIEVRGNVQVFVSDGNDEKVKVYNEYYAENAFVQNQNGTLRISSYNNEKLVVWVTASDLRKISVYDNAEVKSFGRLSEIDLAVDLHDNATANLELDGYSASININDRAKANLSGNIEECQLNYSASATVNQSALKTVHLSETKSIFGQPANTDLALL